MVSKKLIEEHLISLFQALRSSLYSFPSRAKRYVFLLRRVSMKYRYRLPREMKHSFCKHCYTPFTPGVSCRTRIKKGYVVYTCFSCKKLTKIGYR